MARRRSGVATRGIGIELERLRTAKRLTLQDVGSRLGVSASTISRLENGKREVSTEEVASILTVIGVVGDERERLIEQARGETTAGYLSPTLPAQSALYHQFEQRATRIFNFELMLVPGLAQTADYAYTAIGAFQYFEGDQEIESRVARRLARQALLTRKSPPALDLMLTEAALRLPIGGTKVMASQIRHLIELAERPHVNINIIPAEVVAHPGLTGSFVIMNFSDHPTVTYVETRTSGMFLDDPALIHQQKLAADRLGELALSAEDSARLMITIQQEMNEGGHNQ